jgi:hypothetical protein
MDKIKINELRNLLTEQKQKILLLQSDLDMWCKKNCKSDYCHSCGVFDVWGKLFGVIDAIDRLLESVNAVDEQIDTIDAINKLLKEAKE